MLITKLLTDEYRRFNKLGKSVNLCQKFQSVKAWRK